MRLLELFIVRCSALLQRPRWVLLAALLTALPALGAGFFVDDFLHLLTLRGDGFGATPLDLFQFAPGDSEVIAKYITTGPCPWYTWPELKLHFFRPLSSATMMLDYHAFGDHAMFYHLHTAAWYMLLAWGVFLIYRRAFALPVAGLCILLYILDSGHLAPVVWWSNRNALVSAAPAVLGLAAHLRWREEGWRPGLPLSLLGYGAGLLGGETALGIFGYVAAYELFGKAALSVRIRCLMPAGLLAAAYLILYKLGGYGVSGSGIYVDPMGEWPQFLSQAPGRMLELVGSQFFKLPVEIAVLAAGATWPLRAVAATSLALFLLALRPVWKTFDVKERHHVSWLLLGALLAATPALATFPSGRLLTLPSLGACGLIGLFLYHGARKVLPAPALLSRVFLWAFAVIHLLLAPLVWVGASAAMPFFNRFAERAFRTIELDESRVSSQRVFCLFAADPYTGFYPVVVRRYLNYEKSLGWQTLSMAPFDHEVTRTGEKSFELRVVNGELLSTPFERLMRSHAHPLKAGDVVACDGFRVTILEAGDWGPREMALDFDKPLDDDTYAFLAWQKGRLSHFTWPAIGQTARLKASEGYFAPKHFDRQPPVL